MNAETFVLKINNLREGLDYFNHFDDRIVENMLAEGKFPSEDDFNKEFRRRTCIVGTYIHKIKEDKNFKNEIENLIINFDNTDIWRLLNVSFLKEIIIDEDLYCFGNLDSYLCYDDHGKVGWFDHDTFELLSEISNSPELFLECMYELAYNNIHGGLTKNELFEKLKYLSGLQDCDVFFKYLIGNEE